MSTSPLLLPLLLLFLLLSLYLAAARVPVTASFSPALSSSDRPLTETVHDLLPQFGLPKGLLPSSVKSYSLSGNGEFMVELAAPCYVQFSDLVYYEKTIKGKLSYGTISDLSGIQAKKLFIWVPITGIVADKDDGTIEFVVGFLSEKHPATEFTRIPTCKNKASSCHGDDASATAAAVAVDVAAA